MPAKGIRVDGVRELTRALNRAGGRDLTKAMGRANKTIGEEVIARLSPRPVTVGYGAGAKVRPSANARLVQLKAGGSHRLDPQERKDWGRASGSSAPDVAMVPWGRRYPAKRATRRPDIAGTALRVYPRIERAYLRGIDEALKGAGGLD